MCSWFWVKWSNKFCCTMFSCGVICRKYKNVQPSLTYRYKRYLNNRYNNYTDKYYWAVCVYVCTSYCTKFSASLRFISSFGPGVSTVARARHRNVSWPVCVCVCTKLQNVTSHSKRICQTTYQCHILSQDQGAAVSYQVWGLLSDHH